MKPQAAPPSLSVIVPIGARRAADIGALYREYRAGIAATGATHEFIFVLDGPRPEARRALETLLREGEEFTIVNLTRNFGEAAALMAGFERSSGGTIVTLPAYQQIEPGDIRKLLAALSTTDLAIGYRSPRHGNALDRVRRSAFHGLVNFVTGARLRDLGCGARAMRRQVLEEIDLYGDQHRFMPILAMRLGFRVSEIADAPVGAGPPRAHLSAARVHASPARSVQHLLPGALHEEAAALLRHARRGDLRRRRGADRVPGNGSAVVQRAARRSSSAAARRRCCSCWACRSSRSACSAS